MKTLKLQIDVVPKSAWGKNLRTQVRKRTWDQIREEAYAKAGRRCEICGASGKLNCHEKWFYDEKKKIQLLTGFQAVCTPCHHVSHYGMSMILAQQGIIDLDEIDKHFLKVNRVKQDVLEEHMKETDATFNRRSRIKWRVEFGKWRPLWNQEQAILAAK